MIWDTAVYLPKPRGVRGSLSSVLAVKRRSLGQGRHLRASPNAFLTPHMHYINVFPFISKRPSLFFAIWPMNARSRILNSTIHTQFHSPSIHTYTLAIIPSPNSLGVSIHLSVHSGIFLLLECAITEIVLRRTKLFFVYASHMHPVR